MINKNIFSVRALTFVIFFGVFMLEVAARAMGFGDPPIAVLDSKIEYYPKENGSYTRFGNKIEINQYGMRSRNFEMSETFDFSVVLFGDSVVYGNHFLDQSETLNGRIEEKVLASHSNKKTLTASVAASSWGPGNLLAYYNKLGGLKGDYAVLIQSSHDRFDIPFASTDVIPYRLRKSYLASLDLCWAITERLLQRAGYYKRPLNLDEPVSDTEPELRELIGVLKSDFETVYLVFHPTVMELNGEQSQAEYYQTVAQEEGIEYQDFSRIYKDLSDPQEMYRDNIHPSALGTRLFSSAIFEMLKVP